MNTNQQRKFQTGDVVRLKSGGYEMTVFRYETSDTYMDEPVLCKWFEGAGGVVEGKQLTSGHFPEDVLVKATNDHTA
jgi:uncharacterized protein YodC (DUF2158 family)